MQNLRCWAEIDLAALERNLNRIRSALPPRIKYISVVKADAYGHGIHPTAARLMQSGVDLFAVANVKEAADIREMGSGWPILILGPLLKEEDSAILEYDLIPSLSNEDELNRFI
ncbi:MAG: alanine racemase, partial [Verrucomicrobia bacterium]|nr:alanine racemase [Verrucomicrobiota bacterium]